MKRFTLSFLFSLPWQPFEEDDYLAFAGAEDEAHIAYWDNYVFVRSECDDCSIIECFRAFDHELVQSAAIVHEVHR